MILDPHNRPTLEDILGESFPLAGVTLKCDDCGAMLFVGDSDNAPETHSSPLEECGGEMVEMPREDFLSAVAESDPIVAAVFDEWEQRFGDGPKPSPMNEIPNDPLLGVNIAVPANPRV